jgi:hypothetical protein
MKGKEFLFIKSFKKIDETTYVEITRSIEHPKVKETANLIRTTILLGGVVYKVEKPG